MDEDKTPGHPDEGEDRRNPDGSFWSEARDRGRVAGERVGREWEKISGNAKEYADEHSIGVALGALGMGIAIGVLLGLLVSRD